MLMQSVPGFNCPSRRPPSLNLVNPTYDSIINAAKAYDIDPKPLWFHADYKANGGSDMHQWVMGPGSWADRADVPDLTFEGEPKIVPLRSAPAFGVASNDVDPRGLPVIGGDGQVGGEVVDLWVDRSEMVFRYLEVEVAGGRRVLLPMNFARVQASRVRVQSIFGAHFVDVPGTRSNEQVTFLEEEKIMAYYGAGTLYASPARLEPLI